MEEQIKPDSEEPVHVQLRKRMAERKRQMEACEAFIQRLLADERKRKEAVYAPKCFRLCSCYDSFYSILFIQN